MIIQETCPKCGQPIFNEVICTNPPIPRKVCYACGWSWEGEREQIVYQPFVEPNEAVDIAIESIQHCIDEDDPCSDCAEYEWKGTPACRACLYSGKIPE